MKKVLTWCLLTAIFLTSCFKSAAGFALYQDLDCVTSYSTNLMSLAEGSGDSQEEREKRASVIGEIENENIKVIEQPFKGLPLGPSQFYDNNHGVIIEPTQDLADDDDDDPNNYMTIESEKKSETTIKQAKPQLEPIGLQELSEGHGIVSIPEKSDEEDTENETIDDEFYLRVVPLTKPLTDIKPES